MSAKTQVGGGNRREWSDLPAATRATIEERLGGPVVRAVSAAGGFSPGLAARLETAGGAVAFVKAVCPEPNAEAPALHRREALVAAALPAGAPVSRLRWSFDEGADGWVVLAFDAVDGANPPLPWRPADVAAAVAAVDALGPTLTPSPVPEAVVGRVDRWGVIARGWWQWLAWDPPAALDPWSRRHLDALAALEADAPAAAHGETLLHLDLRGDNLLIGPGGVTLVDWPHARIGAPWVDLAFFAPSLAMQGGPPPPDLFARSATGRAADPAALRAVVAALAGFFTATALMPPVPGLPTLRRFQADQAVEARRWLAALADLR